MDFIEKVLRFTASSSDVHCICCEDRSDLHINGVPICSVCSSKLPWLGDKVCTKCGRALPTEGSLCNTCSKNEILFCRGMGVFEYKGLARDLVHSLKYGKNRWLTHPMALLMAKRFNESGIKADAVTFMPMHERRLNERGFNQAREIALHFSKATDIPFIDLLLKRINTPKQSRSLHASDRYKNIKNMLTVHPHIEDSGEINEKRIVLIDDVYTTGASMNEAARALLSAGAKEVYCVYFAGVAYSSKASMTTKKSRLFNKIKTKSIKGR
ncbi:MAG: ComF family protein [Clostridiales bacterium]|nr:ComF family protein [Clostridiales bacterium]